MFPCDLGGTSATPVGSRGARRKPSWRHYAMFAGLGTICLPACEGTLAACPPGSLSIGDVCRPPCVIDADCVVGELCLDGFCLPRQGNAGGGPGEDGNLAVVSFTADPTSVRRGETSVLSWSATHAQRVAVFAGTALVYTSADPDRAKAGVVLVAPESETTYRIEVERGGSSAERTTRVALDEDARPPNPLVMGTTTIEPLAHENFQDPFSLSWNFPDAQAVDLEVDGTSRGAFGTQNVLSLLSNGRENLHIVLTARASNGDRVRRHVHGWFVQPGFDAEELDLGRRAWRFTTSPQLGPQVRSFLLPALGGGSMRVFVGSPVAGCVGYEGFQITVIDPLGGRHASTGLDARGCPSIELTGLQSEGAAVILVREPSTQVSIPYAVFGEAMHALCGDGARTSVEACDDGNLLGGDGCSPDCTLEPAAPPPNYVLRMPTGSAFREATADLTPIVLDARGGLDPRTVGQAVVGLPFRFRFYGRRYAGLVVDARGFISFLPSSVDGPRPASLGDPALPNAVIAPWAGDLRLSDFPDARGEVLRASGGSPGDRWFEVHFRGMTGRAHTARDHVVLSAKIRLEERTGAIEVRYDTPRRVGSPPRMPLSAGLESETGQPAALNCASCEAVENPPTDARFTVNN